MFNKKIFSTVLLAAAAWLPAQNLLKNGDFNGNKLLEDVSVVQNAGRVKVTSVTEHLNWNKCLRMEIVSFKDVKGRKQMGCSVNFGKNGKNVGFPVEPNTTYEFSFEIKGNQGVALWTQFYDKATDKVWLGKTVRALPKSAMGNENDWIKVKGSFKTKENTKFATLVFQFWADSKHLRKMPQAGNYVMLDNVVISKRKSVVSAAAAAGKVEAVAPRMSLVMPGKTELNIPQRRGKAVMGVTVESKIASDKLSLALTLPAGTKPVSRDDLENKKVWQSDVVEIFFAPFTSDRSYTQFVVSSANGRYYGTERKLDRFDQWQGKCEQLPDGKRKFSFEIPWKLLGIAKAPAAGTRIGFNIGLQINKKVYTSPAIKFGFNDVNNFGSVIFGSVKTYRQKAAEKLSDVPESLQAEVKKFAASAENDPGKAVAEFETLQKKINSARLGSAPFLTARLDSMSNFSYPLEITPEQLVTSEMKLSAARNEIVYLRLAIMNRTAKTAAYRVIVHENKNNFNSAEFTGLGNNFPAGKIVFREALPIKDSDGAKPGMIFDPLPEMNQARVVTVPAGGSALVWLEFDCHDVPAGKYNGSVRIIPLAERSSFKRYNYKGQLKDYPLELEVLDVTLPPPMQSAIFSPSVALDYAKKTIRLGNPRFMVTGWHFPFKFDNKGNLIKSDVPAGVREFNRNKEIFSKLPGWVKPRYVIGYSVYDTFKRVCLPKSIKPFTPEWENCWSNYLKALRKVMDDCGIDPATVEYELVDEPRVKHDKEYLAMTKIAKATLPDARFSMTWGPLNFGYTVEKIEQYDPYLSSHCYHWLLLNSPGHMKHIKRMQQNPNVTVGLYECSTNIRENPYTYFRLHPWRVHLNGFNEMGFYTLVASPWGQLGAPDWKSVPTGPLTYRVDDNCIPSIRMFSLQQGVDDIRYFRALEKLKSNPEVAKFLSDYSGRILKMSYNQELAGAFREGAKKLLVKYQK